MTNRCSGAFTDRSRSACLSEQCITCCVCRLWKLTIYDGVLRSVITLSQPPLGRFFRARYLHSSWNSVGAETIQVGVRNVWFGRGTGTLLVVWRDRASKNAPGVCHKYRRHVRYTIPGTCILVVRLLKCGAREFSFCEDGDRVTACRDAVRST